jgi:predicted RNA-binding Zn-ribbon protein involved in translation (DUF1610 family)
MPPEQRDTPVTFGPDEAQQIRRILTATDAEFVCPRCGSGLVIRGPVGSGDSNQFVWEVRCPPCYRSLYVRDLPESHRPRGR